MEPVRLDAGPVVLRPHRPSDIAGVLDQCQDRESQAWTTFPVPYTREHAESFVLEQVPEGWRDGSHLALAIADAETDEFLGTVNIRPTGTGGGSIGFGLRPQARGRGAASAAVRAFAAWAFSGDGLGLDVLHWQAAVGNWPSRRVAWATGFRLEGTIRAFHVIRGRRHDMWVGSLKANDERRPPHPWFDVPTLRGERCVLRRFTEADADAIVEGCNDPATRRWLAALPSPYTRETALSYIRSREEEHASGHGVYWAAADPKTDACWGSFGIMQVNLSTKTAEVGYWLHPAVRGRGITTEAVRMLVRHASIAVEDGGLGLRRLTLNAAGGNVASQRVAEKAGFTRIGHARRAEPVGDGEWDELVLFERLLR